LFLIEEPVAYGTHGQAKSVLQSVTITAQKLS